MPPIFTEPEANNCYSMIFKDEQKTKKITVVLMMSLHGHGLFINLLVEFGSKTNERNTTRNKFF